MKVVILAGGLGTRISEESQFRPKPMVEIGGRPILWHIMKLYSQYGFNEFIICAGYKQNLIKEWFANYYLYTSDITFDFSLGNRITINNNMSEPWKVTVVDTGLKTMTGGRIKRIQSFVNSETFMLTYGDAVSNVNINRLVDFHKQHGKIATISAVINSQRFGLLSLDETNTVVSFREKFASDGNRINAGFMVLNSEIFNYIENDNTVFEKETLVDLSAARQLKAYQHDGFWQCMDTKREMDMLEGLWSSGQAPWKIW